MTKMYDTAYSTKSVKLLYGVGYNSQGRYKTKENGIITKSHEAWRGMIRRCYSSVFQTKYPTYKGCSVDEAWHDYQVFAEWFNLQAHADRDYELDKDLLIPGNKVYSSDTCCFVPQEINKILNSHSNRRGLYPQGVHLYKKTNSFKAQIRIDGKVVHLGYFKCPNRAHERYREAKESYVKEKAVEWRGLVEGDVFTALMRWQLI